MDLEHEYSNPISTAVHGHVLGIPEHLQDKYYRLFAGDSSQAEKVYFVREVLEIKRLCINNLRKRLGILSLI